MIVTIATPLETRLVDRIRSTPGVTEVLFDPKLLPAVRYPNDHMGDPTFTRDAVDEARFESMLARANALFGYPGDSASGLARAVALGKDLRFVQGTAAGMGATVRHAGLDPEALRRVGFASAAGVHGAMLAEFVFYGLLALRKDAARLARERKARSWAHSALGELDGSAIAILGMGGIGSAIAVRANAFGMRVLAITRTGEPHPLADRTFSLADIREAFAACDAAVVTLPITTKTQGLVDATTLAALRPHAIFCNVGRGAVVDQDALTNMLRDDRLAGAVLDVFEPEPLPSDHLLWDLENVIFSPHTAALSVHENDRIVDVFCENVERTLAGRPLRNAVDVVEFY